MKSASVILAVGIALVLQATMERFLVVGGATAIDFVLVVVVYTALAGGPVTGILAGTVGGLLQDALAGGAIGIIGIGGLAKSFVGFVTGVIGRQFIVTATLPRFVIFSGATMMHAALFHGLYVSLGLRPFPSSMTILSQTVGNAAVGMIAFAVTEALSGASARARETRWVRR